MKGYSEDEGVEEEDHSYLMLYFRADSFQCDECGLTLFDSDELTLAGMYTSYDRDEDLDKWVVEHYPTDYSEHV